MNPFLTMPPARYRALALLLCAGLAANAPEASAADLYMLPNPAGTGDGTSWQNAAKAPATGDWSDCVARLNAGDTLHVGSGLYEKVQLKVGKKGATGSPVAIAGKDTGGGLPVFRGSWNKDQPAVGETFCSIGVRAGFVTLKNLRIEHYLAAVVTAGGNEGIVLSGLAVKDVRFGAVFKNSARADDAASWTRNVLVEKCTFVGLTKSALRWEGGNHGFHIVDCEADAGGKPYATDPFHMLYDIRGDKRKDLPELIQRVHDHDITFIGCTARNSWHEPPAGGNKKYWNGDGFVAERGVSNLTFIGCKAFDCTDGGFDLKASNMTFKDCVSFRNKRNFRIWDSATLENCIVGFPTKRGGSGGAANIGFYAKGELTLNRCTVIGDAAQLDIDVKPELSAEAKMRLKDCLVISIRRAPPSLGGTIKLENCDIFMLEQAPHGPVFASEPSPDWDGNGSALDASRAYGGKGYRHPAEKGPATN